MSQDGFLLSCPLFSGVSPGPVPWAGLDLRALAIEVGAAAAATVLAGACWISWAVRDRDKDALVTAIADFSQRRLSAPTRPEIRLVRAVRPR